MNIAEVRDIVRENVGRDKASEHLLKWALDQGLREIEKRGNYYWMRAVKTWSAVVNQQAYSVTTSSSGGLNLPNFKDTRILLASDQTLPNPSWDEVAGPIDMEDAGIAFADTDQGFPQAWGLSESTTTAASPDPLSSTQLLLYPPKPDKTYSLRLHYYQWTSLPTATTSSAHEVLVRWPEALIYLATEAALQSITKDPQYGRIWRDKFEDPKSGEWQKIVRYDRDRQMDSRVELRPWRGPLVNHQRRWSRNRELWL